MSNWTADLAYAHIFTAGARGRISERSDLVNTTATAAQLNSGRFDLSANVWSISLKANY